MTTPYRNQIDALRERKGSLEAELEQLRAQSAVLEGLRARQAELDRELAAIESRLGAGEKRALPLLDQVRVASPCSANWNEMTGDATVRFCDGCQKNVYDLSAMPREAAEQFLVERAAGEVCVRFYQRADGTIITDDCPVGVKRKRRKKLALAVAGAGAMAFGAVSALSRPSYTMGAVGRPIAVALPGEAGTADPPGEAATAMGVAVVPESPPASPPPPPPRVHMGVRARTVTK